MQRVLRYHYRRPLPPTEAHKALTEVGLLLRGEHVSGLQAFSHGEIDVDVDDGETPMQAAERYVARGALVTGARWVEMDGQTDLLGGGL